jgi:putative phage-type endonuclease
MSFHIQHFKDTPMWLQAKLGKIGGSSASSIIGKNPWQTNKEAYADLMGLTKPRNLDDNEAVQYGKEAEQHIRALFALDNKKVYEVINPPESGYDLVINDERPYMCGTLDGQLVEKATGRKGVLEIKTSAVLSSMQNERWYDRENKKPTVPINYYIQVLHYLLVTEYAFAILVAELKYEHTDGSVKFIRQTFMFDTVDEGVKNDLAWLLKEEEWFYSNHIATKKEPALILPF